MMPVGNILALAHTYLVKYQILFSTFRVAVSAVTDLNKKEFPLYTFCPDWLAPIHPEGLYEGKVNIFSFNTVFGAIVFGAKAEHCRIKNSLMQGGC